MNLLAFNPSVPTNLEESLVAEALAAVPWVAAILVGFFVLVLIAKSMLHICPPNEVLFISGGKAKLSDGSRRGYKAIFGGRAFAVPVLNQVYRMSLNTIEVPINIRGAYSRGGIPLNVDAIANVKISSDERLIGNAAERFLGRDRDEIRRVAKETLEGHLRGVLATLTPEEVNEDRLKFAEALSRESEEDLSKLGLHVDTLKIQHVTDDVHYLDSVGRAAIAQVIRAAEMAESDRYREAEQTEAAESARAKVVENEVDGRLAQLRNQLRKVQADLEAEVRSEQERTEAAAREARAKAEQELQKVRAELAGIQLMADTVLPAEAERQAQEFRARGEAAIIRERGAAVATALSKLNEAWKEAGDSAMQIAVIEDLEKIIGTAAKGVTKIKIEGLRMIDGGDGRVLANYISAYPDMLESVFRALQNTTGLDVPGALRRKNDEVKA